MMDAATAVYLYDSGLTLSDIGKKLQTSTAWVSRVLTRIGVHNQAKASDKFWTDDEDAVIQDLSLTAKEASKLLPNRSEGAVKNRRTLKGLNKTANRKQWTEADFDFIKEHSDWSTYKLAKHFNTSYPAIHSIRSKHKFEKKGLCVECGVELGSRGKYCKEHQYISRQISFYKNRMLKYGGDLSDADINVLVKGNCTYCGDAGGGIDRVDSAIGYFKSNTVSCCTTCNVMKMDKPKADWLNHIKKVLEHSNEQ